MALVQCFAGLQVRRAVSTDDVEEAGTPTAGPAIAVDGGDASEVAALVRQLVPTLQGKMYAKGDRTRFHSLALLDLLVKQVNSIVLGCCACIAVVCVFYMDATQLSCIHFHVCHQAFQFPAYPDFLYSRRALQTPRRVWPSSSRCYATRPPRYERLPVRLWRACGIDTPPLSWSIRCQGYCRCDPDRLCGDFSVFTFVSTSPWLVILFVIDFCVCCRRYCFKIDLSFMQCYAFLRSAFGTVDGA